MYRQMRGWRHDYRGHIQTMKVLAAQGNLDGIKAYLDALDTDLNTVDLAVKTGNAMADAIMLPFLPCAELFFSLPCSPLIYQDVHQVLCTFRV